MIGFISFGSGSSGNSYYLYNRACGIMIDAGISARTVKRYFTEYGLRRDIVRCILVTHDHADHVKYVGKISSELAIPVYATSKVHDGIERNYCVHNKIEPRWRHIIVKGQALKIDGGPSVTPFNVPHDSSDNVGYKIEWEGSTLCLITDAGHVTDVMSEHINVADYLIIEANHDEQMLAVGNYPDYLKQRISSDVGHLSNKTCADAVWRNASERLRHVWLCHLSQENNHPEIARKAVEAALRQHGRNDIPVDILKRNAACGVYNLPTAAGDRPTTPI